MSCSSCIAALGLGAFTSLAIGNSGNAESHWRKGAEREARLRAQSAREAAVIRKRYDEMQKNSPEAPVYLELQPRPSLVPSPPPLVAIEPARKPLRPR
jgi:hypothetical protein